MLKPDSLLTFEAGFILTYPYRDFDTLKRRVEAIKSLGVDLIEFTGPKQISNINLLGKGTRSIIVKVWVSGYTYALKIRRLDSSIPNLKVEAENMKIANSVSVGPKLIAYNDDMILMEIIHGKPILEWISMQTDWEVIRRALRKLIIDAYRLDLVGLDHGELSRATKHIFVKPNDEPVILDFGSSSINRRPSNVTSIVSYLFIRGGQLNVLQTKQFNREHIVDKLRQYKLKPCRETLRDLLEVLDLT